MITYGVVEHDRELIEILELQRSNLAENISEAELNKEGFVTVHHDLDLLKKMNYPYPHIIAKSEGKLIAYALVMLKSLGNDIAVLRPMFQEFNKLNYDGQLLSSIPYVVMGQVCIMKGYRGMGVFQGLYKEMASRLKSDFRLILTEIASSNPRSIRAHEKVGFEALHVYTSGATEWHIVALEIAGQTDKAIR